MSGLKGITVNTAPEAEPHIYAEDDAAIFQSIFGQDGVSSIGQACKATVLSNNKVRIADGVVFVGGHFARIPYGEYEDCEIANGQSGKNRNDIIVAKFVTTGSGGIDTMTCEVKQGTAGTTATDPAVTQDNIYEGGKIREFPLYRVKIEGLSIVAVEQLFTVVPTNEELIKTVEELNSKMPAGLKFKVYTIPSRTFGKGTTTISGVIDIDASKIVSISGSIYYASSGNRFPIATPMLGTSGAYSASDGIYLRIGDNGAIDVIAASSWANTSITLLIAYTD